MTAPKPAATPLRRRRADPGEIALGLRHYYGDVVAEPLDPRMAALLARLEERAQGDARLKRDQGVER
jgi:hypothetical protein